MYHSGFQNILNCFVVITIVPHSTEGVFDLCNIADLLIYSLLVKSMTTFIIFIFFMISIPFAPNDTYSPFLVYFPFFYNTGHLHAYNIPQDIIDKLRLCTQADIQLAGDFIELLVKRNSKAHNEPNL